MLLTLKYIQNPATSQYSYCYHFEPKAFGCHNSFPTIPTSLIAPHTWFFSYQLDLNVSPMLHVCSKPLSDWLPVPAFHSACKAPLWSVPAVCLTHPSLAFSALVTLSLPPVLDLISALPHGVCAHITPGMPISLGSMSQSLNVIKSLLKYNLISILLITLYKTRIPSLTLLPALLLQHLSPDWHLFFCHEMQSSMRIGILSACIFPVPRRMPVPLINHDNSVKSQ